MDSNRQLEFALLARLLGPSTVPADQIVSLKTYRQAVRYCWEARRVRRMTFRQLAAEAGLFPQHVGDYFNPDDNKFRRDLPGDKVRAVEAVLGNTAITQWHLAQALESMEEGRVAA